MIEPPEEPDGRAWVDVTDAVLPLERALTWASRPDCGALVVFCGTVRDHSEGRPGVTALEYEVYPELATRRLAQVAESADRRWPCLGRLALLHRVGRLEVGEISVVVVASTPHRAEAFEAARFCIDRLKQTVPIWKRETWAGGTDWSLCSHDVGEVDR